MLKELPKVGQMVRYLGGDKDGEEAYLEVGEIYEVIEEDLRGDLGDVTIKADSPSGKWYIYGEGYGELSDLENYVLITDLSKYDLGKVEYVKYIGGDPNDVFQDELSRGKVYKVEKFVDERLLISNNRNGDWYVGEHENNLECFEPYFGEVPTIEMTLTTKDGEVEDVINAPNHYTNGKFETFEVIEHVTRGYANPFVAYAIGNVIKYVDRAPYKHETPVEDLRKAIRYLEKSIEVIEREDE